MAKTRGLDPVVVDKLIELHTEDRFAGFFGEPGVNVLELNVVLDDMVN